MGVIYSIMNPKGKLYIGKTYNLNHRIASHKCATKRGSSIILHNSIRKYGWDNHLLSIIEEVEEERLNDREIFWINAMKTYCYENPMGMNMTLGGDGQRSTWMHDTDRRKAASKRFYKEKNPFFGKRHTEAAKKTIAEKASKRNKENGTRVPDWGAKKGVEKSQKRILAYDKDGNFVSEFKSLRFAAKKLGLNAGNISSVLCNTQHSTEGYVFKYFQENYPLRIDVSSVTFKRFNTPILLLDCNHSVIKEYKNGTEAQNDIGIHQACVARAARTYNYKPLRSGHIFIYKDQHRPELN